MVITLALIAALVAIAAIATVLYLLLMDNRLIRNELLMINRHIDAIDRNYKEVTFEKAALLSNDITRLKLRTDRIARIIGFTWDDTNTEGTGEKE